MLIHFYLRFSSKFGQRFFITGNIKELGNNELSSALPLAYLNQNYWFCSIDITIPVENVTYQYILQEADGTIVYEGEKDKNIDIKISKQQLFLFDTWNNPADIHNVFYTKPFTQVFSSHLLKSVKYRETKIITHEFKIKTPLLNADECVCISGSGEFFKNWDVKKLLPLKQKSNWHSIKINLSKEIFPVEYKYGIYNQKNKTFRFEEGNNRIMETFTKNDFVILHDGFVRVEKKWKGSGLAVPVFSIRTENGFGTGEFSDIKLLVDWAKLLGIKLLQFLPVNDTIATNTFKDSYPYSAISAFALHPLYINIDKVAGAKYSSIIKPLTKKKNQLNKLLSLDYESVMKFKLSVLKELFELQKDVFFKEKDFKIFFSNNKDWLIPYAAFCFLRDKNKTADFSNWATHKIYNKSHIEKLVSPNNKYFKEIGIQYFIQYHLHLQLKEVSAYAKKNGVALKGDLPIGVSRYSCDVWADPLLYNVNEQAGAPPDAFAVTGQNWGFPTYNWHKMQEDEFAWWRKRFDKLEEYFDVLRIDHILGFFRIWSIPINAVQGILGRFVPAKLVSIAEFNKKGIWFDHDRYCLPFISDEILLKEFGDNSEYFKQNFLDVNEQGFYILKEAFNTQRKVEENFIEEEDRSIKNGLFNLISNIILIKEDYDNFHFRINMENNTSFQNLDPYTQHQLKDLYIDYFFERQDELWKKEALQKLPALKSATNMLLCGEDLGMVPGCVPEVMKALSLLSLEVQRMPKSNHAEFLDLNKAPYLSVVTPATHDMSTIRLWWQENKEKTQTYFNYVNRKYGEAPEECDPWMSKEILLQHFNAPAMWSILQIQDLLGISKKLRSSDLNMERINEPSDPNHFWKYRMHLTLEHLIKQKDFNSEITEIIKGSGRE